MHFRELNLNPSLLSALEAKGYTTPTPIQAAAIPPALEGKDVLGCAQTGTGKTAAFALPILQTLSQKPAPGSSRGVRALILSPTRELALQISDSFRDYGRDSRLRSTVVFGGVSEIPQKRALKQGVEILVATPGRLLDLHGQGAVNLGAVEIFVLDEADRMLDMGFIHDMRRIAALLPTRRQTLFFSATLPPDIQSLSKTLLRDPVRVEVAPVSSTAANIDQSVYQVPRSLKPSLLRQLVSDPSIGRALIFTRTKHGADKVCRILARYNIQANAMHGNKTQGARQRALADFRSGRIPLLVATDVAARGIDVADVSHVFNYDLPEVPETYVHRIGRTARAGASGIAVAFCDPEERAYLNGIERLIRRRLPVLPTPALEPVAQGAGDKLARDPAPRRAAPQAARSQGPRHPKPHGPGREHNRNGGHSNSSGPGRTGGHSSQSRSAGGGSNRPKRSHGRRNQPSSRRPAEAAAQASANDKLPFWKRLFG